jgi:glycosyltransferase involved in cell wall biosynthesis
MKYSKELNKLNIGVITLPFQDMVGETILSNFIDILEPLSNELFVITGKFPDRSNKKIHTIRVKSNKEGQSMLIRILRFILTQLRISYNLIKIYKKVDIVIFYIGARVYPIPMLFTKLLRKKTVVVATGSSSKAAVEQHRETLFGFGGIIFPAISGFLEHFNFHLANQVAVESEGTIDSLGLNKYRKKISIAGSVYIDTDNFKMKKDLKDKRNLIGYIGRLSLEKGVQNFAKAIPLILKERNDLDFLIGGGGLLFEEIKNELKNNGSYDKVELTGWISHDELPKYLNELKLIVSPSYTEGGVPTVIMEAMACGTVSLVTPVAGVDVIKDGESGFILEDNSPECIAKNVIRALEHPNLDEIVNNACNLVEEEFSYEKVVKQYRDMIYRMLYNKE